MGRESKYIQDNIPALYRKAILDVMIYTYISAQRDLIPSISVDESAKAFLRFHNIDEGDLTLEKIRRSYFRIQNELYEEQKGRG